MLSTKQRVKLIDICVEIVNGRTVPLDDMIWAEKLAHVNPSARTMMHKAREGLL